jgi:hypothetical protein
VADLYGQLMAVGGVRNAYLVRKQVRYLPEKPLYVFAFVVSPWWRRHNKKVAEALRQKFGTSIRFPGETLILNAEGQNHSFAGKCRRVRDSHII